VSPQSQPLHTSCPSSWMPGDIARLPEWPARVRMKPKTTGDAESSIRQVGAKLDVLARVNGQFRGELVTRNSRADSPRRFAQRRRFAASLRCRGRDGGRRGRVVSAAGRVWMNWAAADDTAALGTFAPLLISAGQRPADSLLGSNYRVCLWGSFCPQVGFLRRRAIRRRTRGEEANTWPMSRLAPRANWACIVHLGPGRVVVGVFGVGGAQAAENVFDDASCE
jgi:hypothetical protein